MPLRHGPFRSVLAILALLAAGAVLTSCPNPLPVDLATQVGDTSAPVITITSPAEDSPYQSTVTVTGTVADSDGPLQSLVLTVPAVELREAVEFQEDGSFSGAFSTIGVSSSITFELTATDWNGNVSIVSRRLENDGAGPRIVITEPEDYSSYGPVVRVSGAVTDAEGRTTTGEVASAAYSISGTSLADTLTVAPDGTFSFEFQTRLADGTQVVTGSATVELTAEDWNGNVTAEQVTVTQSATGDFPSFTVTPGNKQVTLEWEPVLHAESYTVHNLTYFESQENVASGFEWTGLENGLVYSFQVTADLIDGVGEAASSTVIATMPLGTRTFTPFLRETAYESLTIAWWDSPHVDQYLVESGPSPAGPWLARAIVTEAEFTDWPVERNVTTHYRVTPAGIVHTPSDSHPAVGGRFGGHEAVGMAGTAGSASGADVQDTYLYVADGAAGLTVLDISDPASPTVIATEVLTGNATSVDVEGLYAYLAVGSDGLAIIDISTPSGPVVVNYVPVTGEASAVAVQGSYAYVTSRDYDLDTTGVNVIDVSTPGSAFVLDYVESPSDYWLLSIDLDGTYAYVGGVHRGVHIYNITNPLGLYVESSVDTYIGAVEDLQVVGPTIFAADGTNGLTIFDATDPANPGVHGAVDTTVYGAGVTVVDDVAYIADGDGGLCVIDVSDLSSPRVIQTLETTDTAHDVVASNGYIYVAADDAGVVVFTEPDPHDPVVVGTLDTYYTDGLDVVGNLVFMANSAEGILVVDVTDRTNPVPVGTVDTSSAQSVSVSGSYAFVADGSAGVRVVDVSDPTAPTIVATLPLASGAKRITVAGPYAYVGDDYAGLAIVDISDPEQPVVVAYEDTSQFAYGVAVQDGYAYVASWGGGLAIIDVSDPGNPTTASGVDTDVTPNHDSAKDVAVSGSYALVANDGGGLLVVDVATPQDPQIVEIVDLDTGASAITIRGEHAYLGGYASGLVVVDISDPLNPGTPTYLDLPSDPEDVAVAGSYAYVANASGGLWVVELWEESE